MQDVPDASPWVAFEAEHGTLATRKKVVVLSRILTDAWSQVSGLEHFDCEFVPMVLCEVTPKDVPPIEAEQAECQPVLVAATQVAIALLAKRVGFGVPS